MCIASINAHIVIGIAGIYSSRHSQKGSLPVEISREAQEKLVQKLGLGTESTSNPTPASVDLTSAEASPLATIARIIEDVSGISAEEISASSALTEDLNLSSVSLIEIAVRIEDAMHVQLAEEDIWSAKTVEDLINVSTSEAAAESHPTTP